MAGQQKQNLQYRWHLSNFLSNPNPNPKKHINTVARECKRASTQDPNRRNCKSKKIQMRAIACRTQLIHNPDPRNQETEYQ